MVLALQNAFFVSQQLAPQVWSILLANWCNEENGYDLGGGL